VQCTGWRSARALRGASRRVPRATDDLHRSGGAATDDDNIAHSMSIEEATEPRKHVTIEHYSFLQLRTFGL
jgi:hypothetical protein